MTIYNPNSPYYLIFIVFKMFNINLDGMYGIARLDNSESVLGRIAWIREPNSDTRSGTEAWIPSLDWSLLKIYN